MNKELIYIKGFAKGRNYHELSRAIRVAEKYHKEQTRIGGEPYINHPSRVTAFLISLGITDEKTLCGAMLHDVPEDCRVSRKEFKDEKISDETIDIIFLLDKTGLSEAEYFDRLAKSNNVKAWLIKLADRFHNVSTMTEAFTQKKIHEYLKETREYVLPLYKLISVHYPEYSSQAYALKFFLEAFLDSISALI